MPLWVAGGYTGFHFLRKSFAVKQVATLAKLLVARYAVLKSWEVVEDKLRSGARENLAKTYAQAYGDEWLASVANVGFDLSEIRHL